MNRQFIQNITPEVSCTIAGQGTLFHLGQANISWRKIAEILSDGKFPETVRGNFAFVWVGIGETIAAVDHVCTYPLFYSNSKISHIFYELLKVTPGATKNPHIHLEIELLGGQSFASNETTFVGINRILPGHYLRGEKQISYISMYDHLGDGVVDNKKFEGLVESEIFHLSKENNSLLLSGGTDSTALAGIIKKIGLEKKFSFVHAYSNLQPLTESHLVEQAAKEMDIDVIYSEVRHSGDVLPAQSGRQFSFWIENPFLAKRLAIENAGLSNTRIFTGELGDQLFGGPKNAPLLNYALQTNDFSTEAFAIAWINLSATYGKQAGTIPCSRVLDVLEDYVDGQIIYEKLLQQIIVHFEKMKTNDFLNRVMLLNYIIKGPYRTWAYSQDTLEWAHPFASWEIFDYSFSLKSSEKIKQGGIQKYILLENWKEHISALPWKMPKHGFGIPSKAKIRESGLSL